MKKFLSDPTTKWIVLIAVFMLAIIAALPLINLSAVTVQQDTQRLTPLDLSEAGMRIYAQIQHDTNIPWVLLAAVDMAENVVPEMSRAQTVARQFVQKGALERGLTIAPITNAADLAGLYSNNRKTIEKIAKKVLALQDIYLLIQAGKYPADGGTISDETDGCTLMGITEARSPFSGTVKSVQGASVSIECGNGFFVRMDGIANPVVKAGAIVRAGEKTGDTATFKIAFFYKDKWIHPYPYLLMWMPLRI